MNKNQATRNGTAKAGRVACQTTSRLPLLAGWDERLAEQRQVCQQQSAQPQCVIPLAPGCFINKLTHVEDAVGSQTLLDFARQRPLSFIGIDCEFRYGRPGVAVKKDHIWQDPRSIMPMLLALA